MKKIEKHDLLRLKSFSQARYENFALPFLVAYCVRCLREWEVTPSLENIAVMGHRLFPTKFSLVGWPQFPDINRVNRSVLQMRPKYRNLATSASDKGVFLNSNGEVEATALLAKLGAPKFDDGTTAIMPDVEKAERGPGRARSVHAEDIVKKVRSSQLYGLFLDSRFDEAEAIHLIGMLGVYDHTPSREKRRKLKEFIEAAAELDDKSVCQLLELAENRFATYLSK